MGHGLGHQLPLFLGAKDQTRSTFAHLAHALLERPMEGLILQSGADHLCQLIGEVRQSFEGVRKRLIIGIGKLFAKPLTKMIVPAQLMLDWVFLLILPNIVS